MSDFTLSCPHCAQHLVGDTSLLGAAIDCPSCGQRFAIPASVPTPALRGRPLTSPIGMDRSQAGPKRKWTSPGVWIPVAVGLVIGGWKLPQNIQPILEWARQRRAYAKMTTEAVAKRDERLSPPSPLKNAEREDLERFGRELAADISANQTKLLSQHFDVGEFTLRSLGGIGLDEAALKHAVDLLDQQSTVMPQLLGWTKVNLEVKCLGIRTRQQFPTVLMRARTPTGGAFYFAPVVRPTPEGWRIVDMDWLTLGVYGSDLHRALVVPRLPGTSNDVFAHAFGLGTKCGFLTVEHLKSYVRSWPKVPHRDLAGLGARLYPELQESRIFVLLETFALVESMEQPSSDTTQSLYGALLEFRYLEKQLAQLERLVIRRPVQKLWLIDQNERPDKTLLSEDELSQADHELGGDPFVKSLIAKRKLTAGSPAEAARLLEDAVRNEPSLLEETSDARLRAAADSGDFAAVLAELRRLDAMGKGRSSITMDATVFGPFLSSREGREWLNQPAIR